MCKSGGGRFFENSPNCVAEYETRTNARTHVRNTATIRIVYLDLIEFPENGGEPAVRNHGSSDFHR